MRLTVLTATLSILVAPAMAQDKPAAPQVPAGLPAGLNVFFSPAGQPFRAAGTQPYPIAVWFAKADADKDGKISHDEFVLDSMTFFVTLDLNKDGQVNSPENTRYETQIAPEITRIDPRITQPRQAVRRPDPAMDIEQNPVASRYIKRVQGAAQYSLIDEPQPVRAADANLDFRVSDAEWLETSEHRFTLLDSSGDNALTLDELAITPAQAAGLSAINDKKGGQKGEKKRFFGGSGN